MKLRLELWPYRLQLRAPLATAHGEIGARAGLLVCAFDGAGAAGFGEAAPLPSQGTETLAAAQEALAQAIARGLPDLEQLAGAAAIDAALDAIPSLARAPAARAGLELALLDLAARRAGVPLRRLLARARAERREPSASIEVSALLSARELSALAAEAAAAVAAGFRTLKLKVAGGELTRDLARVAAVRAAAGEQARIRLDANGGWSEREAEDALRALARFRPELCEQPVAAAKLAALRRLRALALVPIAADESLASPAWREALLEDQRARDGAAPRAGAGAGEEASAAVDALVLKPALLGGLIPALRFAERARARGLDCVATTMLEGAIGRAGSVHLAAALGGARAHGLATGALLAEDLAPELAPIAAGRIALPKTPGLGVVPDAPRGLCPISFHAARTPAALALSAGDERLDYAALDERVRRFESCLRARGLAPGATIALLAEASPDAIALLFAAARAGATVALLNARLLPAELARLAARAQARFAFASPTLLASLPGALPLDSLLAAPAASRFAAVDETARWTLLFTSGTTGVPKAAALSLGAHLASARAARALLGLDAGTRWLCSLPLFHVGGLAIAVRCALVGGAAILQARFEARAASAALDAGATHLSLVATTLARLLDAREGRAPASLRAALIGGGPVPAPLLARAVAAGMPVLQTYGLTESASLATCERPGDADGSTAGPAVSGTQVRVVDEQRRALSPGEEGAIELRGPSLFSGYLGEPAATAAALEGGWLRTGDLGALDARGRLRVLARRTDLIVSGGENVYPAEVEAALLAHPSVAEAAVGARPDAQWGESAVALVVARAPVAPEELRAFCRQTLAPYKVPRELRFVDALPLTANGKLDRAALRAMLERS